MATSRLTSALHTRIAALTNRLGPGCRLCAGRDFDRIYFRNDGCLRDGDGNPVPESVLEPCPGCGRDSQGKFKVIAGVDPKCI